MEIEIKFEDLKPEIQERLIEFAMERIRDVLEIEAEKKEIDLVEYVYKTFDFDEDYGIKEFKRRFRDILEWLLEDKAVEALSKLKLSTYLEIDK